MPKETDEAVAQDWQLSTSLRLESVQCQFNFKAKLLWTDTDHCLPASFRLYRPRNFRMPSSEQFRRSNASSRWLYPMIWYSQLP